MILNGQRVPVTLKTNARARRFILRLDHKTGGVAVTVPTGASSTGAMAFAAAQASWIEQRLCQNFEPVAFAPGSLVPVRGRPCRIDHRADKRGTVWLEEGHEPVLAVAGDQRHVARRLRDWLVRQARDDATGASAHYSEVMNVHYKRITMRDPSTRWGSCSSTGGLSYSWRLIMAPPLVLDYVCAHEVAHLRHMDHSGAFWSLVYRCCARTDEARCWLKAHGPALHRYGR